MSYTARMSNYNSDSSLTAVVPEKCVQKFAQALSIWQKNQYMLNQSHVWSGLEPTPIRQPILGGTRQVVIS